MKIIIPSPYCKSIAGHYVNYYSSMQQAISKYQMNLEVYLPLETEVEVKKNWKRYFLEHENKIIKIFYRTKDFFRILRDSQTNTFLFYESYCFTDLVSFIFSSIFIFTKKRLFFFIRDDMRWNSSRRLVFLFFMQLIKCIYRSKVQFVTDSEVIQKTTSPILKRTIHLLPIPHAKKIDNKNSRNSTVIWCPGRPLDLRGKDIVISSIRKLNEEKKFIFFLSEEYKQYLGESIQNVEFLPSKLSQEQYENVLSSASTLFLPYKTPEFESRTSGIFVEAIVAGKNVFTTKGSWLAHELMKYGLEEFCLSEEEFPQIIQKRLNSIHEHEKKLALMKEQYTRFHNANSFGEVFCKILNF